MNRFQFLMVLAALVALPHVLLADSSMEGRAPEAVKSSLDQLFAALKNAETEAEGRNIEADIWTVWSASGVRQIDEMMAQAREFMERGLPQAAFDELSEVIDKKPDYVDGWNRRAWVLFTMSRYRDSLQDVERVLALEPRHFGALAGKALIHIRTENWRDALKSLRRAVAIHPFLKERHLIPELEQKLGVKRL